MTSTPLGKVETASSGNSGNPATVNKLSNKDAQAHRGFKSGSTQPTNEQITQHRVSAANTGMGETANGSSGSVANGNIIYGPTRADASTNYELDRYRTTDDGRTPARQIDEILKDEPASVRVSRVTDDQEIVGAYSNFILQSVSEAEQEKYQIVETFTAYYAFFYGKRPPVYNYSGMLINDQKHNWAGTFKFMYDNYFRGTATAELGAQAYITYGNKVVSGFILNLSMGEDASNPNGIPFSFSLLVISHSHIKFSDNFEAFIEQQQKNLALLKEKADADIKQLNKNPDPLQNLLKNNALTGKLPAVFTGKSKEKAATPTTNKATSNTEAENKAIKAIAISGNEATVGTDGEKGVLSADVINK